MGAWRSGSLPVLGQLLYQCDWRVSIVPGTWSEECDRMFTTRPEIRGSFGVVASTHWLASGAGMAVLEQGGNAFDAAAAAAFTLHVVEPHLNGPGGEVPIILRTAADPRPRGRRGLARTPARSRDAAVAPDPRLRARIRRERAPDQQRRRRHDRRRRG